MREVKAAEGIPDQAIQALNKEFLDILNSQRLQLEQGPRCRITQRFPFAVQPEDSKRVQVVQETDLTASKKAKTVLLTFEAASNKMPIQLKKEMNFL